MSGSLNGSPNHDLIIQKEEQPPLLSEDDSETEHDGTPPRKKRKLAGGYGTPKSLPRTISPPWKKVEAEGPSSFVEDGKRKSARTNVVPLELQPKSDKRTTRAESHKVVGDKVKHRQTSYNISSRTSNHVNKDASQPMSGRKPGQSGPGRPSGIVTRSQPSKSDGWKSETSGLKRHKRVSSSSDRPVDHIHESPSASKRQPERRRDAEQTDLSGTIRVRSHPQQVDSSCDRDTQKDTTLTPRFASPELKLKRITFRVKLSPPSIQSPGNIPLPKAYPSFQDFLENDNLEPRAGSDLLTPSQVSKEAEARQMVAKAKKRGRALAAKLEKTIPDPQKEPERQYAHHDHIIAHIRHFRSLLREEGRKHKRNAKRLAEEAVKYVEARAFRNKVKSVEELEQEAIAEVQEKFRNVVKDLDKQWELVEVEVSRLRQIQWEEERQQLGKAHLNRVLEQHTQMLESRLDRDSSNLHSSDDNSASDSGSSGSDLDETNESNMSTTESDSESDEGADENDARLNQEELRQKYAILPERPVPDLMEGIESTNTSGNETHPEDSNISNRTQDIRGSEVDESDPSTDMDSDINDESNEDADESGSDGASEGSEDENDDIGDSYLGLYSSKERAKILAEAAAATEQINTVENDETKVATRMANGDVNMIIEPTSATSPKNTGVRCPMVNGGSNVDEEPTEIPYTENPKPAAEADKDYFGSVEMHVEPSDILPSREPSTQASPQTSATNAADAESFSSVELPVEKQSLSAAIKTPVPSLLRGTLRPYQHEGLDWLADLYANNRNGILADEMGLGKTIQSIALLAHLAVKHEVWGPHLIVVPTSVMLNWEMEFKKFCPGFKILTYYGSQEERKEKRRGWNNDDLWNVCITSYQLVLQDQNAFKRRNWHYMILDEAHNIKNWRSQRWQTMLTFKTRARLLLTGTPLQNNLAELWSLLFFLRPTDIAEDGDEGFAGLKDFSEWFRKPVDQILEHGRERMDDEAREQVAKLHKVIRPYLLRRLKADVEKQMPAKYEHVELCKLSKRQRQLYDGFMSRAQTKETLASGNYLSIINCLMQLRKVCNHPDLFEERPITTSFAMSKSVVADYEVQDLLVRRRLLLDRSAKVNLDFLQLAPISHEEKSSIEVLESTKLIAYSQFKALREAQYNRINWEMQYNGSSIPGVLASMENAGRQRLLAEMEHFVYVDAHRHHQHPIYGTGLLRRITVTSEHGFLSLRTGRPSIKSWETPLPSESLNLVQSVQMRAERMGTLIQKFACITPAVVANDMPVTTLSVSGASRVRNEHALDFPDPFHEAQTRLSIAFPDKRLLQYDCGKLQRLDKLLRDLMIGGHRALIFTQMTRVLDILERFLNIHGYRYLRLDGATKIEQRQILTDRFNNDARIPVFILSSRSGGLGINLTGADTVIFYDLDWNPAMDKQCTDRAHRIGQTRDVHIYKFVSDHTIESNILRKSNQKRMLDDVVIQEGDFTTDYFNKLSYRDALTDDIGDTDAVVNAAMDKVLGQQSKDNATFEQAEDQEDIAAARVAAKEVEQANDGDFDDSAVATPKTAATPVEPSASLTAKAVAGMAEVGTSVLEAEARHIDEYMIALKLWLLKDVPTGFILQAKSKKNKNKKQKGVEHRMKRVR